MSLSDDHLSKLHALIERFGNAVQAVFDPEGAPPNLAYSVGNCTKGLPEVVMFGLGLELLQRFVNDVSRMMQEGSLTLVDHGETTELAVGYKAVFRRVRPDIALSNMTMLRLYCKEQGLDFPEVFQVVFPDADHRFPWDDDCKQSIRDLQPAWYGFN